MNYHGGQLTRPPLRAQHATSSRPRSHEHRRRFLRPDSIKQARQQLAEGIIDAAQLREIENNAIRHLVQQRQCDCGLHVVTDSEFRRAHGGISISSMACRALNVTMPSRISSTACRPKRTAFASRQAGVWRPPDAGGFPASGRIGGDAQPKMTIPTRACCTSAAGGKISMPQSTRILATTSTIWPPRRTRRHPRVL